MAAPSSSASGSSRLTVIAVIAALGLGASTVYFALDARAARKTAADRARRAGAGEIGKALTGAAADRGAAAGASDEVRRLRAENLALMRRLAEHEPAATAGRPYLDGGALRGWLDRLEEMRKTDPERYRRIMERREQRRTDHEASLQEQFARIDQRLEALGNAETAAAKEEAELLNKIAAVMSQLSQLGDKMQSLASLPESERGAQSLALGQQGRDLYNQLQTLRQQDRQNQLNQLGAQLGLSSDQTASMASAIDRIVKETDPRNMRPRGPGGPGGPGGRSR
jgi:chromosome segregation ATPase